MFKSILVLESSWETKHVESKSVWPFVNEFAKATDLKVKAYHQSFTDKGSFIHWVRTYDKSRTVPHPKLLYIAAHGTQGGIATLKRRINGQTIANALQSARSIQYVHFGSCLFGSNKNLKDLLRQAKHLKWAAGYDETVDWVDSTLFDIMLWGRITSRSEEAKGQHAHTVVKTLLSQMPAFAKELGFRLQYRFGKKIKSATVDEEE